MYIYIYTYVHMYDEELVTLCLVRYGNRCRASTIYRTQSFWKSCIRTIPQNSSVHLYDDTGVSWNGGTLKSSIYRWIFHFKLSILGYPHGHGNPILWLLITGNHELPTEDSRDAIGPGWRNGRTWEISSTGWSGSLGTPLSVQWVMVS